VFENRVLRRIFGPKRDEVTRGWRKLHNEELHILCFCPSIIRTIKSRRMGLEEHVARMVEKLNAYRIFEGKSDGKRPLGRPRGRWLDNIKLELRETGWDGMDSIDFSQDKGKVEGSCNHGRKPSCSSKTTQPRKCSPSLSGNETDPFSRTPNDDEVLKPRYP
jgi:hypothetical protein